MIKCCDNCANLILYPRNNKYSDVDYLCIKTGYFVSDRNKDITKIKRYSPGGKELECKWKSSNKNQI